MKGTEPIRFSLSDVSRNVFKIFVLLSMCFTNVAADLLVTFTRQLYPGKLYLPSTVVLLTELLKLVLSLIAIVIQSRGFSFCAVLDREVLKKPKETSKILIPAFLYTIQNNLYYYALSNLDPTLYIVTAQMKIFTTAIFMRVILKVNINSKQWLSLGLLVMGIAMVQMSPNSLKNTVVSKNVGQGLIAMSLICVISGFSGVYFELLLKSSSDVSFWVRNLQMYFWGTITSSLTVMGDYKDIVENGFFQGYTKYTFMVIMLLSFNGVSISLVMCHLDNIYKMFTASISIVIANLGMLLLFDMSLSNYYLLGTTSVCVSIVYYNLSYSKPAAKEIQDTTINV